MYICLPMARVTLKTFSWSPIIRIYHANRECVWGRRAKASRGESERALCALPHHHLCGVNGIMQWTTKMHTAQCAHRPQTCSNWSHTHTALRNIGDRTESLQYVLKNDCGKLSLQINSIIFIAVFRSIAEYHVSIAHFNCCHVLEQIYVYIYMTG